MALKKSNLGIHDASKHLNREINSQLEQIIFDLGIQGGVPQKVESEKR